MQTTAPTPSELIVAIEAEAEARKLSIDDLCRQVELNRATWQRLKAGMTKAPRLDTYRTLEALHARVKALPMPEQGAGPKAAA
jgi:DNA-binding Xre family transcriptional regulator